MSKRVPSILVALLLAAFLAPAAVAQDDCHCDCYFSGDCRSGEFCNWGTLGDEDTCWWRTPKPEGSVGAGCDEDYHDWGQCDGLCSPTALGHRLVGSETRADLSEGVSQWARVLTDVSLAGGGVPSMDAMLAVEAIGFNEPSMSYGLWRMVVEVLVYSRGEDYIVRPKTPQYALWEVAVGDLRGDPDRVRNGELAIEALLAEIDRAGAGREIVRRIDASKLDPELFERICPTGGDRLDCLYERIADLGEVLGRGAERHLGGGGGADLPPCAACAGDCEASDRVDTGDLLSLLGRWGATDYPCEDMNQDGIVDTTDLLGLLSNWGVCAP